MRYRLAAIVTSCLLASGAWAQLTDTESVREAMFSAANISESACTTQFENSNQPL